MKVKDSSELLKKLSLAYISKITSSEEPKLTNFTFCDVVPFFSRIPELCKMKLYKHQLETFLALSSGYNVILISGTGSGKTEAWILYALHASLKTLAIYPNLALSADQLRRIKYYSSAFNLKVMEVNADVARVFQKRREKVIADIVVTNPAYLMTELKAGGRVLDYFLRDVDLIVIDELAYYGSSRAALLIKMLELLVKYMCTKKPSIVILTATLGNPETIRSLLYDINQKETVVIQGKPRHVENRIYIVLGKEIPIRKFYKEVNKANLKFISKEKLTLDNFFEILLDLDIHLSDEDFWKIVPREIFDWSPEDILVEYIADEGVTLVFTNTIQDAEIYAKRVKEKCRQRGIDCNEIVKTHHHLIFKEEREKIEKAAREGKIKLIFSPRTLEQGIDIGTVVRVVHIGLPEEVRQFLQREGRKGRRKEIPFTETIILPVREFDRIVLRNGFKSLKEWLELGNEELIIESENLFLKLFTALYKLFKLGGRGFDDEERNLLLSLDLAYESYGVLRPKKKGKIAWANFQFYAFGEPIGVRRILLAKEKVMDLPQISRNDLISKFQIGYIDPQTDGVVVDMGTPRFPQVTEIMLREIFYFLNKKNQRYRGINNIKYAIINYYKIKKLWNEEANFLADYREGYIDIKTVVRPIVPNGFGLITYRSAGVQWIIESRRKYPQEVGKNVVYLKAIKMIPVSNIELLSFRYHDFTYGYKLKFEGYEPADLLAATALLKAYLRISRGISLRDLSFCVYEEKNENVSYVIIWETQAIGILQKLDYDKLIEELSNLKITDFLRFIVRMIDKMAYIMLLLDELKVKRLTIKLLENLKKVNINLL